MDRLTVARRGYILISILFYLMGTICILFQDIPLNAAMAAGGTVLIVYGVIKIIGYLSNDLYCLAFQYDLACGILLIAMGIVVLFQWERFSDRYFARMGLLILLDSLLSVQTAVDARRFGMKEWGIILGSALLSATLGLLLFLAQTQLIAGIALLSEGFTRQYIVQTTVKASPRPREG